MADSNRTQFAMQALSLADYFRARLGDRRVSGYKVVLAAPEGPSTGGGKQAIQHISLIPDAGGATITAGSANPVERRAELRTWEHLVALHSQRFRGKQIPLDKVAYNELLKRMQAFFTDQRLSIVIVDAAAVHQPSQSRVGLTILGIAIAAATAGAVFFFLQR
jgi:hypothetical protein